MRSLAWPVVIALTVAGCAHSDSVTCGDLVCADGTTCVAITLQPGRTVCAHADELADCAGKDDFTRCAAHPDGRCYSGVCQDGGCGNGVLDLADPSDPTSSAEVCDDGNRLPGDGCAVDCLSNETCGNHVTDASIGEGCDDGNGLSHDGCASACAPEVASWSTVEDATIGSRDGYGIAYDAARERIVMFGGTFANTIVPGTATLEWDGLAWHALRSVVTPSSRKYPAMAYDPIRKRVVMFGGLTLSGTPLRDTWEWDGNQWIPRSPSTSPAARGFSAMVYDPTRKAIVLFGGRTGTAVRDPWTWDGTTWQKLVITQTPQVVPALYGHSMVFDPRRGKIVVFGGATSDSAVVGDMYELTGDTWSKSLATGPGPRWKAALVADPVSGHLVLAGGNNVSLSGASPGTGKLADVWDFDGTTWTARDPLPVAMDGAPMAALPVRSQLVIVDGQGEDTYARLGSSTAWTALDQQSPTPRPQPRWDHAAAFDPLRRQIVMFGGRIGAAQATNETWVWKDHWSVVGGTSPTARYGASMAFDPAHRTTVMFGGYSPLPTPTYFNETWLFDGSTWTLANPATKPSIRAHAALGFDPVSQQMVMFGGEDSNGKHADTYLWNGVTWAPGPTVGPNRRQSMMMATDPVRRQMIMFGGETSVVSVWTDETWAWDGTAWQLLPTDASPPARSAAGFAYDPAQQRLVLFGGSDGIGSQLGDAWTWTGADWELLPFAGLVGAQQMMSLVTSPDGAGVFMFGGYSDAGGPAISDAHLVLSYSADETSERCGRNDTDGDGRIACADPDCWPSCTPSCPPGVTCAAADHLCGDGMCTAAESCASCAADCGACPVLCGDARCDPGETCPADCP